jgi:hypothetical protein
MSNEFHFSENFRLAAEEWVDRENAAQILEETKSLVMAQRQAQLGDIPVNRAEQTIKASPGWMEHVEKIVEARRVANLAKVKMEVEKMRFHENQGREANARAELRL